MVAISAAGNAGTRRASCSIDNLHSLTFKKKLVPYRNDIIFSKWECEFPGNTSFTQDEWDLDLLLQLDFGVVDMAAFKTLHNSLDMWLLLGRSAPTKNMIHGLIFTNRTECIDIGW